MAEEASADEEGWQVYLLRCGDGTLYTGVTSNLERRLRQHNGEIGGGARYTRARRPVTLLWSECCTSRGEAQRWEARIKTMSRSAKLRLSRSGLPALPDG
ncbi:MAG: GIY-YIG nuclease family protein [Pseudomonadota bacterium]